MIKAVHLRTIALAGLLLPLFFLPTRELSAQEARMLNTRDTALEWAYLERISSGIIPPTTIQSLSVKEALFYEIDTGYLSSESPSVRGKISIQPFVMGWKGLDTSRAMWNKSLFDRFRLEDPALLFGVSFASPSFYGTTSIDFGTDSLPVYAKENGSSGFWKPLDYVSYWTFPEEGYLSYSGRSITVAAGRLKTGIGLGRENIFLNGDARWYDQIQFSWYSTRFRFFALWGTSSSHLNNDEYSVQTFANTNADGESMGWDRLNNHDASVQSLVPLKMFSYHRIEYKPLPWMGFGLSEMQLVGGKVPDLSNLLPTVIWHNNYSAGVSNVMLHADTWMVPVKNLLVFGEFLMDDSKAPKESGASKPNCWGWTAGMTWTVPVFPDDWRFSAAAEFSLVDKWTYDRWQPYLTMYQRQIITGGHRGFNIPLGHGEGGDVSQAILTLTALSRKGQRLELAYTFIDKGPVYLGMIEKNPAFTAGSGKPEYIPVYYDYDDWAGSGALKALLGNIRKYTHVLNAKAVWPLSPALEANGEIDFRIILNAGHIAGKKAAETTYKAGLKWTYGN